MAASGNVTEAVRLTDEAIARLGEVPPGPLHLDADAAAIGVALHVGDADRARAVLRRTKVEAIPFGEADWEAMRGLTLLQEGQPEEALVHFEAAQHRAVAPGPRANGTGLLALAKAAAGQPEDAIAGAAEVLGIVEATYLDRTMAQLGKSFASLQLGKMSDAQAAMDDATREVGATGDRVQQACVGLARARLLEAVGSSAAASQLERARSSLSALGAVGDGWDRVYRMAASRGNAVTS
jgi:hypothetical protein